MNIRIGSEVICHIGGENIKGNIIEIELCEPGEKYGESVKEVRRVQDYEVTISLDCGRWAYGEQISLVTKY